MCIFTNSELCHARILQKCGAPVIEGFSTNEPMPLGRKCRLREVLPTMLFCHFIFNLNLCFFAKSNRIFFAVSSNWNDEHVINDLARTCSWRKSMFVNFAKRSLLIFGRSTHYLFIRFRKCINDLYNNFKVGSWLRSRHGGAVIGFFLFRFGKKN